MISNRQGGRRRGRGGQRNPNIGGQAGNRQDNRQRGNAAQLLEKYKSMARDAQLSGDRVQMEYFLQYAEHYFRVLNENRSRFDEQRKQRGDNDGDESDEDDDGAETSNERDEDDDRQDERPQRRERPERGDRNRRVAHGDRKESNGSGRGNGNDERIAVEALPPAIGREDGEKAENSNDEAPRPRRARRPRASDGEGEIAPAA